MKILQNTFLIEVIYLRPDFLKLPILGKRVL